MNLSIVVIVIIVANILISLKGFNDFSFFEKYKFHIGSIRRGEQLRLVTSGFLHVDMGHLVLNMFSLYLFADVVVDYMGTKNFVIIYLISLLAGSLLALFFHKEEYHYSAVGASGAIMGVIYSAILLHPENNLYFIFLPTVGIPGYVFGIGYLLYSIYGMKNKLGNIGHTAHFGGAVGGYFATLLLRPSLIWDHTLMVLLLAIPIVVLFILEKAGKI
ncbi:rhomboid family intramembrane serine protease [Leptobacterium flavescens]|uniref:Rhomboid family intramembrane serine protease n=1 Tax=Leptobacterium flavescens TaxID=472055 RepID=A0A6P0UJD4_9FLAO|nr:rhomboid family intramembrane serine protease [Leptobacterium flavescens]NER13405.1 rhomboid family intramembrane serine protease [Leptobacterium flavescens]